MSVFLRKRYQFIWNKVQDQILHDLGKGKITAIRAGYINDMLNKHLLAGGVTNHIGLAKHEYYQNAVEQWRRYIAKRREYLTEKIFTGGVNVKSNS